MSKKLNTEVRKAIRKAMSVCATKPKVCSRPLKKAPIKEELMKQTTACGGVAVGAPSIPPPKKNTKSKL